MSCYTPLTVDSFIKEVQAWMNKRIYSTYEVNSGLLAQGGWECWVQVELAMWLINRGYDVVRESKIYRNNYLRADLVVNSNIKDVKKIAIEIKCETIYSQEYTELKKYSTDIDKLNSLDNSYSALMLVFVLEPTLYSLLLKNQFQWYNIVGKQYSPMALCYKQVK